jgi:hypothetical protein
MFQPQEMVEVMRMFGTVVRHGRRSVYTSRYEWIEGHHVVDYWVRARLGHSLHLCGDDLWVS